jgi:hypothetical protein
VEKMKKIEVIDLFNIEYSKMNDKINDVLVGLQNNGKKIIDFRVMGSALNKCAVFVLYEE